MKQSLRSINAARASRIPLTWITCYDYSFARAISETDVDLILVGDSGGMVALGYPDTVPVTMNEMLVLTAAVRRGAPEKFIVGDMPKGSYEVNNDEAVTNAMRFCKVASADAVKLEGGVLMADRIAAISNSGIPVFGHIGLTPQSAATFGGYRVIGRDDAEGTRVIEDALAVQEAGAVSILLEALPPSLAGRVTETLDIPVFGIGAGPNVDGQLLILHDLLGLYPNFRPKFAKCFVPEVIDGFTESLGTLSTDPASHQDRPQDGLYELAKRAVNAYVADTRAGVFPTAEFSYAE